MACRVPLRSATSLAAKGTPVSGRLDRRLLVAGLVSRKLSCQNSTVRAYPDGPTCVDVDTCFASAQHAADFAEHMRSGRGAFTDHLR